MSNITTVPRKRRPRAVGEVFVSSKSCIYLNPNEVTVPAKAPIVPLHLKIKHSDVDFKSPLICLAANDPVYENIENANIVPSTDNKFTIYVNYDFIKEVKKKNNKSSVRVLEPDCNYTDGLNITKNESHCHNIDDDDDDDVENNKMIQCQQISMYIGEKIQS